MLADTPPPPSLLGPSSFSGTSGRQQAGLSRLQGEKLGFDAVGRKWEASSKSLYLVWQLSKLTELIEAEISIMIKIFNFSFDERCN